MSVADNSRQPGRGFGIKRACYAGFGGVKVCDTQKVVVFHLFALMVNILRMRAELQKVTQFSSSVI